MKFARVLLLLAAFQLEVRVRANSASDPLWDPSGCVKSKAECHVQVGSVMLPLKGEDGRVDAAADSILERKLGEWKILKGSVRVRQSGVATMYGKLEDVEGEAWIIGEETDRVVVRAVNGSAHFRGRDGILLEIPQGLEIWVGALDSEGRNLHGVPSEIFAEDHLRRVARMDRLSKQQLKEQTAELRARWKDREIVASALYDEVAKRKLASIEDAVKAEEKKKAEARQVRDKYRQLLQRAAFEK